MRERVTPSLVISVIALIVALGGVSYAAIKIPRNSVGTAQLKKNSITSAKVRNGTLRKADFAPSQIPGVTWYGARDVSTLLDLTINQQAVATIPTLPAGSYVVSGRANILGGAASSTLLCSLESDAAQNITVPPNAVFPLSMAGVTTLTEPGPITLSCNKSAGTPQVAQAHVIATRVPRLVGASD